MVDFTWDKFSKCFSEKFPSSLLVYPCLPCAEDSGPNLLWWSSLTLMGVFLFINWWYSGNAVVSDYLNNDRGTIYAFIGVYTVMVSVLIAYLNIREPDRREKWDRILINSIGIAILFATSCFTSLFFYDYLVYLPVFGQLLFKIARMIEGIIGQNMPRILISWWGISLSPIFILIPVIGPIVAGFLTLIPQNFLLMWLGYLAVCITTLF